MFINLIKSIIRSMLKNRSFYIINLVAWPLAWYGIQKWFENFAYHVDLTIWPFLLSGLSVLVIFVLTVSVQTIRAATANSVEALRYEKFSRFFKI